MKLSRDKIDIALARNSLTITNLSKRYGVSRARMNVILNMREVTPVCAGRMANPGKLTIEKLQILLELTKKEMKFSETA